MSEALAVQEVRSLAPISYRDKLDTIKQTVAKGATDAQLEMFMTLADKYQLDPFLKEIWFVPGVGIMTGRDGYLKVAQRDANYDGIASAAVCEGDHFEMNPVVPTVTHKFGATRGSVIGAYAIVFHKSRRPVLCFAPYSEYAKGGNVWSTYKSAMICKVAEVLALKRQFGISGLVTEEEIGTPKPEQPAPGRRYNQAQAEVLQRNGIEVSAEVIPIPQIPKPWHTKGEMKEKYAALRELAYSVDAGSIYETTLRDYGVETPDKFLDPQKAIDCYQSIQVRLIECEKPVDA